MTKFRSLGEPPGIGVRKYAARVMGRKQYIKVILEKTIADHPSLFLVWNSFGAVASGVVLSSHWW